MKKKLKKQKSENASHQKKLAESKIQFTEYSEKLEREKLDYMRDKISKLKKDIAYIEVHS